jgi:hypothetical protein
MMVITILFVFHLVCSRERERKREREREGERGRERGPKIEKKFFM